MADRTHRDADEPQLGPSLLSDDLASRIRAASPLASARDQPLSLRAQDDLQRLLAQADVPAAAASRRRRSGLAGLAARLRPRRLAIGGGLSALTLGAAATVVAIAVSVTAPATAGWAVTPPPLHPTSISGTTQRIASELAAKAAALPQADLAGDVTVRFTDWALASGDDGYSERAADWVQPERVTFVRHPDLSGEYVYRAAAWKWGVPPDAKPAQVGSVVDRQRFAAGELTTALPSAPTTPAELIAASRSAYGDADAGSILATIDTTAHEWPSTLGVYAATVAAVPGIRISGRVTDRLGRAGIAFSASDTHDGITLTRTVILDDSTGALLSSEVTYESGSSSLDPGTTVTYICWE